MTNYSDFKIRLLTGILFAVLTVGMVAFGTEVFTAYMVVLISICAYEWGKLSKLKIFPACIYALVVLAITYVLYFNFSPFIGVWIIGSFLSLILSWFFPQIYMLSGIMYLVSVMYVVVSLGAMFEINANWWLGILWLWGCVIVTDISAYVMGRTFGKHKLAPKVSPNKTIEGLVGSCMFTGLFSVLFAVYIDMAYGVIINSFDVWFVFGVGALLAIFAQMGDLHQSKMKRKMGLKDSGVILPGHGGMFDRLDGLLAVIFLVGILVVFLVMSSGVV